MEDLLANALICYDANVMLNLYRYSEQTQNGLIEVFKTFADRTYLPHQVALEYSRNRAKVIVEQANLCTATEDALNALIKKFIDPKDRQPFLSEKSQSSMQNIIDEIKYKRIALESLISNDHYANLLIDIFDKRIGNGPNAAELEAMHKQADERYAKEVPPGYSDLKDKGIPGAYGDYLVWRQIMDIAVQEKRDFILVTDDTKEDWRTKISGKIVGPRHELLEEFRKETGQRVWLLSSEGFLVDAKKAGSTQILDSVIAEVSAHINAKESELVSSPKLTRGSGAHKNLPSNLKLSGLRAKLPNSGETSPLVRTKKLSDLTKGVTDLPDDEVVDLDEENGAEE